MCLGNGPDVWVWGELNLYAIQLFRWNENDEECHNWYLDNNDLEAGATRVAHMRWLQLFIYLINYNQSNIIAFSSGANCEL